MTTESTPTETFESKVSNKIDEAASEGERMLARVWKLIAANGVAAILFGFVLVLWPDIGLTTIVAVVAVYALVRGVLSGMAAFSAPLPRAERGWLTLEAVAGTAIGIALLVWNDISAQALLYVVAAWAIAIGVLMLAAAIQLPLSGGRRLLLALNGLVAGAFGAVMFIEPDAGAVAIVALIAAFTIVIGVMQVGFALELRNVAADVRRSLSAAEHRKARGARLTDASSNVNDETSRRPARSRAGRPVLTTDTDIRSRCLVEESSARARELHAQGDEAPRGGGAGS